MVFSGSPTLSTPTPSQLPLPACVPGVCLLQCFFSHLLVFSSLWGVFAVWRNEQALASSLDDQKCGICLLVCHGYKYVNLGSGSSSLNLELTLEPVVTGETGMNLGLKQRGHFKSIKSLLNLEAWYLPLVKDITVSHASLVVPVSFLRTRLIWSQINFSSNREMGTVVWE